jgi:hypothetical protein
LKSEEEERYKYQCLVRHVIKMRIHNRDGAYKWLNGYTDSYGKYKKGWNELHPDSTLEKDVRAEWALGNRGEFGNWKQPEIKNET